MKKFFIICLCAVMLFGIAGCRSSSDKKADVSKDFTVEGMTITLTEEFKEASVNGYTAAYESSKVAVFVLKESFSLIDGSLTFEQYGDLVLQANADKYNGKLNAADGLSYFEYDFHNSEINKDYRYFTCLFEGPDAFWMVQFSSLKEDYDGVRNRFLTWAKTVKF